MVNVAAVIVMLSALVMLWLAESVTCTVTLNVPAAVGVPDRFPVVLRLSPAGSPVAVHV